MIRRIETGGVTLLPGIFDDRYKVNREYLMELDNTCLLQNFYLEAGIILPGLQVVENPTKVKMHFGWEAPNCQLRGHFLGHFLSAAAMIVANENDRELKAKMDVIVDELAKCQQLNGGEWVGSIPEKYFDFLERNQYIWSPQYTMHKTLYGLMDVYRYTDNLKALNILSNVTNWYLRWTEKMSKVNPHAVYSGEEGGMLEVWATLFELTKDERYLTLANRYKNASCFKRLLEGKDALTNNHANASIPLAHGAAQMYRITKEEKWLKVVQLFWKCAVTDRGMFATTGANSGEFWIPPHKFNEYIGERNQEFCTVYNMVRLAENLYEFTGDKIYEDYIERAIYNGFLAQQNKVTGMPTYFLPLKTGSRKKWGSRTNDFWCCYGTMVQAQTLYGVLSYALDNNQIYVNQYIPSRVEIDGVLLVQECNMKYYAGATLFDSNNTESMSRWNIKFTITSFSKYRVSFRIPSWVRGSVVISLNGELFSNFEVKAGYIVIEKIWQEDVLEIYFPSEIIYEKLDGNDERVALVDGPIVLAALGDKELSLKNGLIKHNEHVYESFPWKQNCYLIESADKDIEVQPLYEVTDEIYSVYLKR